MAKRKKRYGAAVDAAEARGSALDFIRATKRGKQYVENALSEGNCVAAVNGLVGMARSAGIASAFRYESGKTRIRYRDPAENLVTRTVGKVTKACDLPRNWTQWR